MVTKQTEPHYNAVIGRHQLGMLISNFAQIRILHLKIRYKSRYRFCTLAH